MAIYKLGDVLESVSENKKSILPQLIINTGDVYKGEINPVLETNKVLGQFKKTAQINDILFSEIRPGNGRWALIKKDISNCLISTKMLVLRSRENIDSKYAYFILTNKLQKDIVKIAKSRSGTFPQITFSNIKHLNFNLPTIQEQKSIIEIIKPDELLSSSLNRQKNNIKNIINSLIIEETGDYIEYDSIKTGRRNANHEDISGGYNFYTCGSKVRKCSEYSFDGKYILLSGNANLYSWWYDGKFDLYQRVYAIKPSNHFFTTYLSVTKAMRKLREESSGSVIKYIKLNDIHKIKMLDPKYEPLLEKLYNQISRIDKLLTIIENIKDLKIKLMIK